MTTGNNKKDIENLGRRTLLLGATAMAAGLVSGTASAASGHHHGGKYSNIVDAALDCLKTSQACNDHCIDLVKKGDTSLADCMDAVSETMAMCTALSQMASANSTHLPALAKVCIGVCEDCEKECNKHARKHAACKACADSCRACIKACKKIAA